MKKVLLFFGAAVLVSALFAFKAYADATIPSVPGLPGDFDSVNRCRCKNNGCYGGNAISLRAACAKSEEPIDDCSLYAGNCVNN